MRIAIYSLLLMFLLASTNVHSQVKKNNDSRTNSNNKEKTPSKNEIQSEMQQALDELKKEIAELDKQIADAKKNDPESVKDLEDQKAMLVKQLKMMEGLTGNLAKMSDEVYEKAGEEDLVVPKKDVARISSLPGVLTAAQLTVFVKNVQAEVERMIPDSERTRAVSIYNQVNAKYKQLSYLANTASGCWMKGHWEKALFIMGRVCMADMSNADNLNNYAAFLSMSGAEQAAIPILQYLNRQYPTNSTILNNLGQAWFGLGDLEMSKKYLDSATILYPSHSMANASLSKIAQSEGNTQRSIDYLKAAVKETYDPDKEGQLRNLGYELKYADLPDFNYPMQQDPFKFEDFLASWPTQYQKQLDDGGPEYKIQKFRNGLVTLRDSLNAENLRLDAKLKEHIKRMSSDSTYRVNFLEPHNSPPHKLAKKKYQLWVIERSGLPYPSPGIGNLLFPVLVPFRETYGDFKELMSPEELYIKAMKLYEDTVEKPLKRLAQAQTANINTTDCNAIDALNTRYLAESSRIREEGIRAVKVLYQNNKEKLSMYIRIRTYHEEDRPPIYPDEWRQAFVGTLEYNRWRNKNTSHMEMLQAAERFVEELGVKRTACVIRQTLAPRTNDEDDLVPLTRAPVECKFYKTVQTPAGKYEFACTNVLEMDEMNIKSRKPPVPKGRGESTRSNRQNKAPAQRSGKRAFETGMQFDFYTKAPLATELEEMDPAQYSIEYDRWGNLIGLDVQLNKTGTGLQDPDSAATKMDDRWGWNAEGSAQRRFLEKLVIKKP